MRWLTQGITLTCCIIVVVAVATPVATFAASITVTTLADEVTVDGNCSIREAVEAADFDIPVDACAAGSGTDTIVLPPGTYTLSAINKTLVLASYVVVDGAGAATTVIQAGAVPAAASFGVVRVDPGAHVTIRDLTIQNGVAWDGAECGGGISNRGTLTVEDAVITGNRTGLTSPTASGRGGGICSSGPITLTRCTISNNHTGPAAWTGDGGGLSLAAGAVLMAHEITVSGNWTGDGGHTGDGGGMYLLGQATITDSSIVDNHTGAASSDSSGYGGGLFTAGPTTVERTLVALNATGMATVDASHSGYGGGMYAQGETILRNCTVSGNSTGDVTSAGGLGGNGGGLMHENDAHMLVHNCTITANTTGTGPGGGGAGGGVFSWGPAVPGDGTEAEIMSTIIGGNTVGAGGIGPDCATTYILSSGYNLVENEDACMIASLAGSDVIGLSPLLGGLEDNGGPTLTHSISTSSPGFNVIPFGVNGCGGMVDTDQRGTPRPRDGACEMGAFEVGSIPLFWDNFESGGTASWSQVVGQQP